MQRWVLKPIYTGKNIFDYADSQFLEEKLEIFNSYKQAEERKKFLENNQSVQYQINEVDMEIQNEQCSCLKIM